MKLRVTEKTVDLEFESHEERLQFAALIANWTMAGYLLDYDTFKTKRLKIANNPVDIVSPVIVEVT